MNLYAKNFKRNQNFKFSINLKTNIHLMVIEQEKMQEYVHGLEMRKYLNYNLKYNKHFL